MQRFILAKTVLIAISVMVACTGTNQRTIDDKSTPTPTAHAAKESSMKTVPPPPPRSPPPEDTGRYVAWMAERGRAIKDTPREAVELRIGDWGFFDHGDVPGSPLDRTGLDRSKHAIDRDGGKNDWHAFLTTPGLDANGAIKRVAWLFVGAAIGPDQAKHVSESPKITAPTLTANDGTLTLKGWMVFPPNMSDAVLVTITATQSGSKTTFGDKP